jgi:hypothetical protein
MFCLPSLYANPPGWANGTSADLTVRDVFAHKDLASRTIDASSEIALPSGAEGMGNSRKLTGLADVPAAPAFSASVPFSGSRFFRVSRKEMAK